MFNEYKRGDWVKWGECIGWVLGQIKAGRYLIEYQSPYNENDYQRAWVSPDRLTKIDPAVCSILNSIYL